MVQKSKTGDVGELSKLLADAFDDDPIVNLFIRQDDQRRSAFVEFFKMVLIRQTMPLGEVYHAANYEGAALWTPPGKWKLSWLDQLRMAPRILRIASLKQIKQVLEGVGVLKKSHPKEPHFYLYFLCSHPHKRGKGIGKNLMQPMLERCDKLSLPVYLENTKEGNEGFYRHYGFKVTHDIVLPQAREGSALYYTGMWRDSQ